MRIEVVASCREARSFDFSGKTAIIVDVLRATSNMVAGLAHGASSIVPVETVEQALAVRQAGDLLGGERDCRKIAGFDLGNSPFEYMHEEIKGKRIVVTTTNGTRALRLARQADDIFACALLNAAACTRAALAEGRDIAIVCAGTRDVFSLEDGLCAGSIVELAIQAQQQNGEELEASDFALAMRAAYQQRAASLEEALLGSSNGSRLCGLGFREDIGFCARLDRYDLVPVLREGELIPLPLNRDPALHR